MVSAEGCSGGGELMTQLDTGVVFAMEKGAIATNVLDLKVGGLVSMAKTDMTEENWWEPIERRWQR